MNLLPIVSRELRTQARRTSTYRSRTWAAAALLVMAVLLWRSEKLIGGNGLPLFASLQWILFLLIWCLVPLMTADCLSREKREDTLGLLFLTPLRAWEIVVAKGLVHGLRGFTLFLAAIPLTMVPFLLGGVDARQATVALVADFASLLLAISAGLLASAVSQRWGRALLGAGVLAVLFYVLFAFVFALSVCRSALSGFVGSHTFPAAVALAVTDWIWHELLLGVSQPGNPGMVLLGTEVLVFASLVLFFSVAFSACLLAASLKAQAAATRPAPERAELVRPRYWKGTLRRWLLRTLARNPVGWLERRRWGGRMVLWAWLAVLGTIWFGDLTGWWGGILDPHSQGLLSFLAWILAGTLAVTAAGSFARERDSGVMELLLVTPLGERGIIAGRLRGIAGQYLPAVLLLLGLWLLATLRDGAETVRFWFFAVSFLTLPVTGLYFSLRCRNRVHALAWTFAVGLALPLLVNRVGANQVGIGTDAWPPFLSRQAVARFVEWTQLSRTKVQAGVVWPLLRDGPEILQSDLVPIAVQLSSAIVFSLLLQRNLRQRRFALEQT